MPARSRSAIAFIFVIMIAALSPVRAETRTVEVTLALICDIYEMAEKSGRGGYARIASAIRAERARAENVIVAHAGDAISPSLMSSLDKGAHVIDLTNRLGIDVFVPGNHEFDFGPDVFRKRMGEARFPLLAANLRDENDQRLTGFQDTRLFKIDGVTIAVIGLTAENSVDRSSPGNLKFRSSQETLKDLAPRLRKAGADLVVAVAHAPRRVDFRLMRADELDVLLSGDDHDLVLVYDGRTAMLEAKQDGEYLTAIDLKITVEESGNRRKVSWWPQFRIVDTADVEPDAAVAARVAEYQQRLSKELDVPIGKTLTALDSRKSSVRRHETAIGNLIADSLKSVLKADVAIYNGGGIRGNRTYEAGASLTRRDVLTELPFGNKAVLVEVTGAQLLRLLENGLWYAGKASGRFLQVSGLTIRAGRNKPGGQKIIEARIAGVPVDPSATYRLATNSFIAAGREGYGAITEGKVLLGVNDGEIVANLVTKFIREAGEISPAVEGRIVIE
ncbi:MAG: bifunctional metallophosphatase/5'-nucleotidase [Rhizobiales bacterium]|nr:bifunctional metallophosphatase/5'-nucleotidase [Hyphomicrobiales bacterium]